MAKTTKKAKKHDNVRKLILYSIINYIEKHDGRSPTLREIGDDIGGRLAALMQEFLHEPGKADVRSLKADGRIEPEEVKAR